MKEEKVKGLVERLMLQVLVVVQLIVRVKVESSTYESEIKKEKRKI